ncbi:MAG TPA: polyketide synthase, partial [Thermoguttaceae bacterium]|nr:polyketide synthase [Thermoguttaceae bacterium]
MNPSSKYRQLPLAIVGMACRVPGADNLGEFWDMLVAGRSAVGDLPPDRLDQELYYDPAKGSRGKTTTRRGALASRRFDHDRCPISPELVRRSDPTHLVMCQTAAEALRHADMDPMNLTLRNTGVYVGHTIGSGLAGDALCGAGVEAIEECLRETDAFKSLSAEMQAKVLAEFVERMRRRYPRRAPDDRDLTSNMAAGIISKGFGLTGPFMAVNAACASSLEALLQAGRALARGKIDMAIVGGASVCTRDWLVLFSVAQSMSATDSRPFDEAADGLIIAEAYAAVVIKTLERAVADGDPIHGVIRGMGVSSDGRGKSLWAPRREGQVEAIRRAYDSGVDPAGVQYIEAHATATQVGDATEIAALAVAFRGVFPEGKKIPITSAKANLGHALEAAGLIGVVKTALCMRHGLIPAAAKVERLNPTIDWAAAPVYVPLEPTPWPCPADGSPRRAGVNAFGVGGLNVHVVLDEYRPGVMGDSSGALAIAQRWPSGSATGPPLR